MVHQNDKSREPNSGSSASRTSLLLAAFALMLFVFAATATHAAAFGISAPVSDSTVGNNFTVQYDADFGMGTPTEVELWFQNSSGDHVLNMVTDELQLSTTIDAANPTSNPKVIGANGSIPSGTYTLTMQVWYGFGGIYSAPVTVTIDAATQVPTLESPVSASTYPDLIPVEFTLPEPGVNDSVKLEFLGAEDFELTLNAETAGSHTLQLDPTDPFALPELTAISGGGQIPAGVYDVRLSYRDELNNPVASAPVATGVRLGPEPSTEDPPGDAPIAFAVSNLTGPRAILTARSARAKSQRSRSLCRRMENRSQRIRCLERANVSAPAFSFDASTAGSARLSFSTRIAGRVVGGRCRKASSRTSGKRCRLELSGPIVDVTVAAAGRTKVTLDAQQWQQLRAGATTATIVGGSSSSTFEFRVSR